jgi:membrane associated rhomboid family serine protease
MFFLPLYDDNPSRSAPLVTWALIALCVVAFLWQISLPPDLEEEAVIALGFIPATLFAGAKIDPEIALVPPWLALITSAFLHGGWMHLLGNMLYLWIFGNNVEDAMGGLRFLVFYLLCAVAAAMAQALGDHASTVPMIGASGAIAGVLGAYLLLFPRANVRVLIVFFVIFRFVNVPAVLVLGIWFALQLWSGLAAPAGHGGVAFWAHVGGFLAGLVLIAFFKRRDAPLFASAASRSFEVSRERPRRGPWDNPPPPPPSSPRARNRGPWG